MTYTFTDYTIAVTTAGIFQVKSRAQGTVVQSIDLNQHKVLYEGKSNAFIIGLGDEDEMGTVKESTPLATNQVNLTTNGDLCNGSQCTSGIGIDLLIQLVVENNVQTLQIGVPVKQHA